MADAPAPGWYPDPQDAAGTRWWDGSAWTEHTQAPAPAPPAGPGHQVSADPDTSMAALAHVVAIPSAFVVLAFLGPLVVWLVRQDEPFSRGHAAEATNVQISFLIWLAVSGVVFGILIVATLGLAILLLPIYLVVGLWWLYVVIRATMKASRGEQYRYPFTLRFLR